MPKVVLQAKIANQFTAGTTQLDIEAKNIRQLIEALDQRYPGMGTHLSTNTAVAIDGEIFQEPYLESIGTDSEIHLLPMIGGG